MNKICSFCKNAKIIPITGKIECDKAYKENTRDGYGPFKRGAECIYDSDLKDLFEPVEDVEDKIKTLQESLKKRDTEAMHYRDKIRNLESTVLKLSGNQD